MFLAIYIISISKKNREIDSLYNLVKNLKYFDDIDTQDIDYINTYCNDKIYNSKSKKIKDEIN
jgi:ATP-dependent helicase/DNAse subunit B